MLVCPLEHPLYKEDSIDLAQAAPYSFVTLGDSASVTQYFKALCSVAQFAPKIAVECDTISTLYAFLESGQAIAFMPSHSARLNPDKLHSVRIRSPHCSRTIRLCWPAGRELTPPEMLFYSFCKDYFSAFHSHPESPEDTTCISHKYNLHDIVPRACLKIGDVPSGEVCGKPPPGPGAGEGHGRQSEASPL